MLIQLRRCILILLILIGTGVQVCLYAGGQKENRLPEAQKLIDEKKYNDAILILTDIMRTNPDQFTEAEKMIKEIRTARTEYNDLYAKLIPVLNPPKGEAIDEEKAYGLIRAMEALDKTPNKAAVAAFAQARNTIVFAVTNRKFENILDECTVLLRDGKYLEAIDKYLSGFVLHREFFVTKDYGNIILNQIDSDIAEIQSYTSQFKSLYELINAQAEIVHKAVQNRSIEDLLNSIGTYKDLLLEAAGLKRKLIAAALALDAIRVSIQKEGESDIPYLSTLRVLTKGRVKSAEPEGIAGAVERYWDSIVSTGDKEIEPILSETYKKSITLYTKGSFQQSESSFALSIRYADILAGVLDLWGSMVDLDQKGNPAPKGWTLITTWLPRVLYVENLDKTALSFIKLAKQNEQIAAFVQLADGSNNPADIESQRKDLLAVRNELEKDITAAGKDLDDLKRFTSTGIDVSQTRSLFDEMSTYQNKLHGESFVVETEFAEKIARLQIDPLEKTVSEMKKQLDTAETMISGTKEKIDGIEYLVKRPDKAAELLDSAKNTLEKTAAVLSSITETVQKYNSTVRNAETVLAQVSRVNNLQAAIGKYLSRILVDKGGAKKLNDEADNLYNLGNLRLDEAYSLYDRGKYDGARSKYYDAEKALLKSLEYREDSAVRKLLSGEMPKFYDRIMTALNKQIIREVRALINQGKDFYNVEKFIKAEQTFQQARERYKTTHDEPNPEIESWLVKVKKALEATSGRVISQTDPLYQEMIHILNIAEQDFIKGKKLLKEKKPDEAKTIFSEAVKNIEYVKETFPRNFKASVLYLRILEYTERGTFDAYFKSMYESAVAKIKTDPKSADDDLLALAEVKPDYPGIKTMLYRSGVAAGRITPPPAKVDIAKARSLYRKAKRIADADNRAQFPIAIAYLEEAVQIDSNYNTAAVLLDQLRTRSGGVTVSSMSDTDQQKLRYAETLYISGKYLEASIIINQLWSNPKNRSSSKLNDLKKKVEAQL